MSAHEHAHEGAGKEHIIPVRTYLLVAAALYVLTIITVAVSRVDVGEWNLIVAMLIATMKGTLVILFFMHLLYDNKLYGSFFTAALVFLGIFIIITMLDTMRRDDIYEEVAKPIRARAVIYGEDGQPLKKNSHAEGEAAHGEAAGAEKDSAGTAGADSAGASGSEGAAAAEGGASANGGREAGSGH